jgi:polyisoprenoid-binding protein YceI
MDRLRNGVLVASLLLAGVAAAQEAQVYTVDAGASDVHWRVYKAGTFARLGHNHVISAGELTGRVVRSADPAQSTFELVIPYAGLVVDDPELRGRYGEAFSSQPSPDDIAGTRKNMLTAKVLDGEHFSELRLSGRAMTDDLTATTLAVTIEMLGRSVELPVPTTVEIEGDTLVASGEFSLEHADLGMEPFSVMMGALQVGKQLDFSYRIVAHKSGASEPAGDGGL